MILLLVSFMLTVILYPKITASNSEYDPWYDINDDGKIDMKDVGTVAKAFGSTGTPINKTALLLELQDKVDSLNASLVELQSTVATLETTVGTLEAIIAALEAKFPITTNDIADGGVTNAKLAPGAIPFAYVSDDHVIETGGTSWTDIYLMSVDLSLQRTSHLLIFFSMEVYIPSGNGIAISARVDGAEAEPSVATTIVSQDTLAFNFYKLSVSAGVHNVKMVWRAFESDPLNPVNGWHRTLIVIALPA